MTSDFIWHSVIWEFNHTALGYDPTYLGHRAVWAKRGCVLNIECVKTAPRVYLFSFSFCVTKKGNIYKNLVHGWNQYTEYSRPPQGRPGQSYCEGGRRYTRNCTPRCDTPPRWRTIPRTFSRFPCHPRRCRTAWCHCQDIWGRFLVGRFVRILRKIQHTSLHAVLLATGYVM